MTSPVPPPQIRLQPHAPRLPENGPLPFEELYSAASPNRLIADEDSEYRSGFDRRRAFRRDAHRVSSDTRRPGDVHRHPIPFFLRSLRDLP